MGNKTIMNVTDQKFTVKILNTDKLSVMENEWSDLLKRSTADRLFMSWLWLYTWWEIFSIEKQHKLYLIAVYDKSDILMGLAPLYQQKLKTYGVSTTRLQFLGNMWRNPDNIRSEYIDFIIDKDVYSQVLNILLEAICDIKEWDEFVITNHWLKSPTFFEVKEIFFRNNYYLRTLEQGCTHYIDTTGEFKDYLSNLGAKSRSKIYNQRKKLNEHGLVKREKASTKTIKNYFDVLNAFHRNRWGKDVFKNDRLRFHNKLAMRALDKDMLDFDMLTVDGKPISLLYDFIVDNRKYGYQLGLDQDFDKRISVGQLHFGYSIESAFKNNIIIYDFLRGMGKSKQGYKDNITMPYKETVTLQAIRGVPRKYLYKIYDMYKYDIKINRTD
jgi:predicted N-acyltransferase